MFGRFAWGILELVSTQRRVGRAVLLATDDPSDLPAPRLPPGGDAGWAVAELFAAAWLASGRDPIELTLPTKPS